jgi:RHS repeat-associated protein
MIFKKNLTMYSYHYNHQGSVAALTDGGGRFYQHLQYLPYGEVLVDMHRGRLVSPYTFSAKEKDSESGYTDFGARYYTDNIMMWLSVDPMSDERPWISPYNYCQWNPIGRVDTWGMLDDHYFDEDGNYLGDDGEGNAIRIISRSSFDLQTNNGEYVTSDLKEVSLLFSDHVESHGMSEKAQLKVYDHYNTTDNDLENTDKTDNMALSFNCNVEKSKKIIVNLEKNRKFSNNYYNIISEFIHEGNHDCKLLELGYDKYLETPRSIRESNAIDEQMNHPSWEKTDPDFRNGVMKYRAQNFE